MVTDNDSQHHPNITLTGSGLALDCPCYSDAVASVTSEALQEARDTQYLNGANDSFDDDTTQRSRTDPPPPYESLVPRARDDARHDHISITSLEYNSYPVIIKAKELRPGPFGCAGTMRKFTDVIMVSPSMTISDLKHALCEVFVARPGAPDIQSLLPRRPGETTVMTVQASWGCSGIFFRREHKANVTTENWPRVLLALRTEGFGRLKVKYWVESAAEAVYRV